ncbi:MAG TPA: ribosome small subunit-dependent GTPase A [Candidatus Cloacimonadota bacterium]|nr:ribosome small subunit-dependent GTPase A [Candidatus Cloacimonadota bacterium]HPS38034.1 ribosome small subunit-dependent GTPase A [Candidatus Cloacimonadota bacterium]
MKQKDKKKITRKTGKLSQLNMSDTEFLDDLDVSSAFKARRSAHKSGTSYKTGMTLKTGRVREIMTNYQNVVEMDGQTVVASLSGRLKQFQFETHILTAVGDNVEVDISNAPDYRIEQIMPRHNTLSRYGGGSFQKEVIVAANIDQVVITVSWRMPLIKPGLIDRYLCIANIDGLSPIICINKMDLCEYEEDVEELTAYYRKLEIPVVLCSVVSGRGIEELKELLKGKDSVFSGQSGTGKSSLINAIEPGLELATGEVSDFNEKGRHTTTQAVLLPWSFGGHLLDTPGLKTINLHSDSKKLIPRVFPGFAELSENCRFNDCTHTHEEHCAVLEAVENDTLPIERYDSYVRIWQSL